MKMALRCAKTTDIVEVLKERILVADGAMATLLQEYGYGWEESVSDLLGRENPELIRKIHGDYLEAGADIIKTNSFNANPISLSAYGIATEAFALAREAAQIAREIADRYTALTPDKPRFVAGVVGPIHHRMMDFGRKEQLDFNLLCDACGLQMKGLLDGGADLILIETVCDTFNAKAALHALSQLENGRGYKIPVMVSCTVVHDSGRLPSGETLEEFYNAVKPFLPLSVGLNCCSGSKETGKWLRILSAIARSSVSFHPNAGFPDPLGRYPEDPYTFASNMEEYINEGLVSIVGGCCGTTPLHIAALTKLTS